MFSKITDIPKDVNIQKQLTDMHVQQWLKNDVLHFRWWTLIALIIVILVVWWIMLDKSRMLEICLFVTLSTIIILGINEYGEELTLWDYQTDIIPIFPPLSSINLFALPLIYSLVYQHFNQKKRFIWATIIISAAICLIVEPVLSWGGFYHLLHWRYYFSIPIYAVMAISVRAIVLKIYQIKEKNKVKSS
jgi:hypothetical protein